MNVKQHHVHITNKSNYVMSFARGIISSRLKKINICLYLVLATSTILGSVSVLPFQKQWQENWRVFSSGLPTQRTLICDLQILCERTGLIWPTEEESKGQFNCNLQNFKGNYKNGGASVFFVKRRQYGEDLWSQNMSWQFQPRHQENILHQETSTIVITGPGEASPFLEVFKKRLDKRVC